nr:lysozyme inhibitor LprI family protein [uncultured Roseateles sp.]
MKSLLILALALHLVSACAQSFEPMVCMNSTTTMEKNKCLDEELKALDRQIGAQVQRITAALRLRDRDEPVIRLAPAFASSQAMWRQYRDSECSFRSLSYAGGTAAPSVYASCAIDFGRERLSDLQGRQ